MTQAQVCETCGLPVSGPFTTRCFPSCDVPTAAEMDGTGRTQEPSVDVRRYVVTQAYWDPMHKDTEFAYVLSTDHDAALSSLRTELVAARAEIAELRNAVSGHHFVTNERDRLDRALTERDAEIAALRAENEKLRESLVMHGRHHPHCASRSSNFPPDGMTRGPCNCGFDAALGRGK